MIDESAPITGPAYDLNRWHKYKGAVDWKLHSVYFKHEIYRGFWKQTGRPLPCTVRCMTACWCLVEILTPSKDA